MAKFCGQCGSRLNDTALFCGGCGAKLPPATIAPAQAPGRPSPAPGCTTRRLYPVASPYTPVDMAFSSLPASQTPEAETELLSPGPLTPRRHLRPSTCAGTTLRHPPRHQRLRRSPSTPFRRHLHHRPHRPSQGALLRYRGIHRLRPRTLLRPPAITPGSKLFAGSGRLYAGECLPGKKVQHSDQSARCRGLVIFVGGALAVGGLWYAAQKIKGKVDAVKAKVLGGAAPSSPGGLGWAAE